MKPIAVIDTEALAWNYSFLRTIAPGAEVGATVKANAYGLGACEVVQVLHQVGCRSFFTIYLHEALQIRSLLPDVRIVVMSELAATDYAEAAHHRIIPTLNSLSSLEQWRHFSATFPAAPPVWIQLDTGMNRLGLTEKEQHLLAEAPHWLEGIRIDAWLSHLACSDDFKNPMTPEQGHRFRSILSRLPRAAASLCNSSGIFWGSDYLFDICRPGIALYGGNPTPHMPNPMRPVVEVLAPVLQIRHVRKGVTVGYGATFTPPRDSRLATLLIGYADGYRRALGNRGYVTVASHRAPVVGRVSMDLLVIDITDIPEDRIAPGSMLSVIGEDYTIDEAATDAETVGYEILTGLGPRIERLYKKGKS